jgi:DNA-binding response OmpR family regulator
MQVLIVEDETGIARAVAYGVRMTWPDCQVHIAATGAEALARFAETPLDLVVLDVELPPPDGFTLCRHIRERSAVPILMLTVRARVEDKVRALDLGADDYLVKPFDHVELLARLRALVRRAQSSGRASSLLTVEDVTLNPATHELHVRGERVALTTTEYRLLEVLMQHAGTALPHQYLLREVWGPEYHREVQYLRVFVRRLRQKLGDTGEPPRYIQTVWNTGYRFTPPLAS